MTKISVRHCVAQAYGLVLGRPLTVIGLTWLPAAFYGVCAAYLIGRMHSAMVEAVPSAGGLLGQYAFFYFALLVAATALFGATIAVPLTRQAFGLREERAAVHLVIGARELRLFFALIRYYALTVATMVIFAIAAGIAVSQGTHYATENRLALDWLGIPLQTWLNSSAAAAAILLFLFFAVRFGFLLDAVASVEDHAGLGRVRALSHGNFSRIAAILVITMIPAGLLFVACEMTFGGLTLTAANQGFSLDPADTTLFAGILAVALVVLHILAAGASAAAYSEMAEAAAQENVSTDRIGYRTHEPAAAYADAGAAPADLRSGNYVHEAAPVAESSPVAEQAMEIATPEADGATLAEPATIIDWMPPPADAHFGSDPHDAVSHESDAGAARQADAGASEVPVASQAADATPEDTTAGHASDAVAAHPDIADAAAEAVGDAAEIPDHAHDAEIPPPPLDPAGAMSVQSGFHSPG